MKPRTQINQILADELFKPIWVQLKPSISKKMWQLTLGELNMKIQNQWTGYLALHIRYQIGEYEV